MPSIWSVVSNHGAEEPVKVPLVSGGVTPHCDLIASIPEARTGYWYTNKYGAGQGDVQTSLASGSYSKEYPVWYGRRFLKQPDGGRFAIDYALHFTPDLPSPSWPEDVKYIPDPATPRLPERTRILRPEEVHQLDVPSSKPLIVHVHGLTGGSHENYLRAMIVEFEKLYSGEVEHCVVTSRGCNRSNITTPQLFNGGWTNDLRLFIKHVTKAQPDRPLFLVGYSLGGSLVGNYIGVEAGDIAPQIKAAILVSPSLDLHAAQLTLDTTFLGRHLYQPQMAGNLFRLVKNNRKVLDESEFFRQQYAKVKGPFKSVCDFDDIFTGPMFGFTCGADYHRKASAVNTYEDIRVPTLILHAKDDPICTNNTLPYTETSKNPFTHIVVTSHGGHLGWFAHGAPRWYTIVASKYVDAFLQTDWKKPVQAPPQRPKWFVNDRFGEKPAYLK